MGKALATSRFQKIIDKIESLSLEDQESLLEIIHKRLIEQKRSRLEAKVSEAREAYQKGEVQRGTVADLMKVLDE
jgi:lantibiotic modifying enzyme